jgi:hypothetical protein
MITQALPVSFLSECLQGIHNLNSDAFYLALYTQDADLSVATTVYTPVGEIVSPGYTPGGILLTNLGVHIGGTNAYSSWNDVTWPNLNCYVAGGLVYNASKGNRAVDVLSFGMSYEVFNRPFTVKFPPNTSTTAPIIFGGGIYGTGVN